MAQKTLPLQKSFFSNYLNKEITVEEICGMIHHANIMIADSIGLTDEELEDLGGYEEIDWYWERKQLERELKENTKHDYTYYYDKYDLF